MYFRPFSSCFDVYFGVSRVNIEGLRLFHQYGVCSRPWLWCFCFCRCPNTHLQYPHEIRIDGTKELCRFCTQGVTSFRLLKHLPIRGERFDFRRSVLNTILEFSHCHKSQITFDINTTYYTDLQCEDKTTHLK